MTARAITHKLLQGRWQDHFCLPNYTPHGWWECDLYQRTKAGVVTEFEIKVSRADFFVDRKKEQTRHPNGYGNASVTENKHELLARGEPRGPAYFFYVMPAGLIAEREIPTWAGFIEVRPYAEGDGFSLHQQKKAPKLHGEKCTDAVRAHSLGVCYWRMHQLRRGKIELLGDEQKEPENFEGAR